MGLKYSVFNQFYGPKPYIDKILYSLIAVHRLDLKLASLARLSRESG